MKNKDHDFNIQYSNWFITRNLERNCTEEKSEAERYKVVVTNIKIFYFIN